VQPVRRHDAAHRLVLHLLKLRQQHRLRLTFDSRRWPVCLQQVTGAR
jgi:hypothetical protein